MRRGRWGFTTALIDTTRRFLGLRPNRLMHARYSQYASIIGDEVDGAFFFQDRDSHKLSDRRIKWATLGEDHIHTPSFT